MKIRLFYLSLVLVIIISGCSKSDDDNNTHGYNGVFNETCNPLLYPGLEISIDGDIASNLDPQSQEFQDYIACIQNCAQTNPDDPQCMMNCLNSSGLFPAGGAFSLALEITNVTQSDITYEVEPGIWFEPGSDDYQPMLSVTYESILVPAGETITEDIPVFCLASGKSAPDDISTYTTCDMISSGGCLVDIVAILETKNLAVLTFEQTMQVQNIIWSCIEGDVVDMGYLNALPSN